MRIFGVIIIKMCNGLLSTRYISYYVYGGIYPMPSSLPYYCQYLLISLIVIIFIVAPHRFTNGGYMVNISIFM